MSQQPDTRELSNSELETYVLNEHNKYVTKQDIENILKSFGIIHKVKNLRMFQIALTHESYIKRDFKEDRLAKLVREKNLEPIPTKYLKTVMPLQDKSYQRLEYLGDGAIHLILAEYLFDRYPDEQEGFMTKIRTKIENGEVLSRFAKVMGLNNYVLIARNIELIGGRENNLNIIEDIFEAFMGALFLETNYETCKKLVVTLMEREIDMSDLIHVETNFKDILLQYYHTKKYPDPTYDIVNTYDENNKKYFTMSVKGYLTNSRGEMVWDVVGTGVGLSKKKGEQSAAKSALIRFGAISEDTDAEYEEIYEDGIDYN